MKQAQLISIVLVILLTCTFVFDGLSQSGNQGQDKKEATDKVTGKVKKQLIETQTLMGELLALTPADNPRYISVEVPKENTDYIFILGDDFQMERRGSLGELNAGDTIKITYEIILETSEKGIERTKRIAKVISFVKPKPNDLRSDERN